jgi:hypothetical protein
MRLDPFPSFAPVTGRRRGANTHNRPRVKTKRAGTLSFPRAFSSFPRPRPNSDIILPYFHIIHPNGHSSVTLFNFLFFIFARSGGRGFSLSIEKRDAAANRFRSAMCCQKGLKEANCKICEWTNIF